MRVPIRGEIITGPEGRCCKEDHGTGHEGFPFYGFFIGFIEASIGCPLLYPKP